MAGAVPETTVVQSRFLALSNEVLLQTLRHCLVLDTPITALMHSVFKARLVRLASINKRLYELSMDIYWKENEFAIGILPTNERDGRGAKSNSVKYPGPPIASLVRRLTINLRFSSDIPNNYMRGVHDLFQSGGDWLLMVPDRWKPVPLPRGVGMNSSYQFYLHLVTLTSDPTRWQQYFHLQELKIIITLKESDREQTCFMMGHGGGLAGGRWQGLSFEQCQKDAEKRLAGTFTNVDAKKTVFEVRGMKCSGDGGTAMCGGACARILEQTLQKMVQK